MRPAAFAFDYDGTLARDGKVDAPTLAALGRARTAGRRLVLVTGRELPDLHRTFDHVDVFDRVVAENGALVHVPSTRAVRALAQPPPPSFAAKLRARGVAPLSVGRVIVATWRPHELVVLETIREMGLALEIVLNQDALMVLPTGVDKGRGLRAALDDLAVCAADVVAMGDAENDHALFDAAGFSVAVGNALPALKARASMVTRGAHGAGVAEALDALLATSPPSPRA